MSIIYKGYEIAYIDYLGWYAILDNKEQRTISCIAYVDTIEEAKNEIDKCTDYKLNI